VKDNLTFITVCKESRHDVNIVEIIDFIEAGIFKHDCFNVAFCYGRKDFVFDGAEYFLPTGEAVGGAVMFYGYGDITNPVPDFSRGKRQRQTIPWFYFKERGSSERTTFKERCVLNAR
jgi:hypothetical protein